MAATALPELARSSERGLVAIVDEVTALAPNRQLVDPALVGAAARAWSVNTIRAFLSDIRLWDRWCRNRGVSTAHATASDVVAYLWVLSGQEPAPEGKGARRSAATISRYLVHIGWAYRMAGVNDPTAAPLVRLEHGAARKKIGTRQRQARGIRFKGDVVDLDGPAVGVSLSALLKACRRDMLGDRDRALLLTAYDTGCRRSELVAIKVGDVEGPDSDGSGSLSIPFSKTDQEGQGDTAYLSPATMRAIAAWQRSGGVKEGALFRRVETYFDGGVRSVGEGALHPNSVTLVYKRLIRRAFEKKLLGAMSEAEVERWVAAVSSHSIRVGVAQDNIAAGEDLPAIMHAYRWRDPKTVMRYGAKLAAKSGASARLAKRFSL